MLFNSWIFIAGFLPFVWGIFHLLQKRLSADVAFSFLVVASLFFYGWWNIQYVVLILLSIVFNFTLGTILTRQNMAKGQKKMCLILGVSTNLAILFYYKYAGFFVNTVNYIGDTGWSVPDIMLPLAISFFTFQQIAYLVDTARGEAKELNFRHYCLFVTFFPQLIAGPIVHHSEMLPQFIKNKAKNINWEMVALGVTVFFIGLFKKVVIADRLAKISTPIFKAASNGIDLTLFEAWLGALAYTFQLYFDFSGYSDMAIGVAALFGICLPLNFLSPYKAQNISDFWNRWHMTLSRFLKDYLYIPLGGNRHGQYKQMRNLALTMVLGGLWHGANWTFVIWGGLHGVYLIVYHGFKKLCQGIGFSVSKSYMPFWKGFSWLLTFTCVVVGWVFFRSDNLDSALSMIDAMAGANGVALSAPNDVFGGILQSMGVDVTASSSRFLRLGDKLYLLLAAAVICLFAPSTHEFIGRKLALDTALSAKLKEPRLRFKANFVWVIVISVMAALSLLSLTQVSEFLYFQF